MVSHLGSVSGWLEREERLLRELNLAVIVLESEALGRVGDFGFSNDDVSRSARLLLDFVSRLRIALDEDVPSSDVWPIACRIRAGMKPLGDWKEDLDQLSAELRKGGSIRDEMLRVLEDVLSLLDGEFVHDLQRLYAW